MEINRTDLTELFFELVSYDTSSDTVSGDYPSTESQFYFGEVLLGKLSQIGLSDVKADKYGYVTATLPASEGYEGMPTVGFISHMDTSPECSGNGIKPMLIENYDGSCIKRKGEDLDPKEFKSLEKYVGKSIICSDGTTLLGSDDKAGIAEIITAFEYLANHPEIKHGKLRLAFTPDEEIGAGVRYFDVEEFGCDFAYTVDGGELGELSYENFNAAGANIEVKGKSVHPGEAKDIMINAALVASEIVVELEKYGTPSTTEKREGFYHVTDLTANVEWADITIIIRDFDVKNFELMKERLCLVCDGINKKYGPDVTKVKITDQYKNMREIMDKYPVVTEIAAKGMKRAGVTPRIEPIRGGTDGAMLSFKGLPCPNMFTGGCNFHGPFEYVCVESMEAAVRTIVNIAECVTECL